MRTGVEMSTRLSIGLKADLLGPPLLYSGGGPKYVLRAVGRARAMGKYSSGIGMTDVAAMMKAIESMHTCGVAFHITTRGTGVDGSMNIECAAVFDVLPGSDLPKEVVVHMGWPTKAASTFDGLCYNLLWQLDFAIQKAYEQMPLAPK